VKQNAEIKVQSLGITIVACSIVIVGVLLQAVPAGAGEVIEVNAGPGTDWILAPGQAGSSLPPAPSFDIKIKVKVGDILIFNQASPVNMQHGLRIDPTSAGFVRRCNESAATKPNAVLVEVPSCAAAASSNLSKNFTGIPPNGEPKPFVLLRVIKAFSVPIDFRCNVHQGNGVMQGQLVMQ
jgi:hypothetical protein